MCDIDHPYKSLENAIKFVNLAVPKAIKQDLLVRNRYFAINVHMQSLTVVKYGLLNPTCCKFLFPCLFILIYLIESRSNQFDKFIDFNFISI